MSEASRWVLTICCALVICGVISALLPNDTTEKPMGLILGLFLLCCFLLPTGLSFSGFRLDVQSPSSAMEEAQKETTDHFIQGALEDSRQSIEQEIYDYLDEYGIKQNECQIYIDTEEGQSGELELIINIRLPERVREYHDVIHKALEYKLGTTVRLEYAGEAE